MDEIIMNAEKDSNFDPRAIPSGKHLIGKSLIF